MPSGALPFPAGAGAEETAWVRWSAAAAICWPTEDSRSRSRNEGAETFNAAMMRPPKSRMGAAAAARSLSNSPLTSGIPAPGPG